MSSPNKHDVPSRRIALEYLRAAINTKKENHVVMFPSKHAYDIELGLKMGVFNKKTTVFHCFERDATLRPLVIKSLRRLGVRFHLYGEMNLDVSDEPHNNSYEAEFQRNLGKHLICAAFLDYCWSLTDIIYGSAYAFFQSYLSKNAKVALTFSLQNRGNRNLAEAQTLFEKYAYQRFDALNELLEIQTEDNNFGLSDVAITNYVTTVGVIGNWLVDRDCQIGLEQTYTYKEADTVMSLMLVNNKKGTSKLSRDRLSFLDQEMSGYVYQNIAGEMYLSKEDISKYLSKGGSKEELRTAIYLDGYYRSQNGFIQSDLTDDVFNYFKPTQVYRESTTVKSLANSSR